VFNPNANDSSPMFKALDSSPVLAVAKNQFLKSKSIIYDNFVQISDYFSIQGCTEGIIVYEAALVRTFDIIESTFALKLLILKWEHRDVEIQEHTMTFFIGENISISRLIFYNRCVYFF
jgi:hypothetical protein